MDKLAKKPGVVAHSFNSIIWETEAEVQGQRESYCETLSIDETGKEYQISQCLEYDEPGVRVLQRS